MVCDTVKPSLREASCCRVDVVKGGAGVRLRGFTCMSPTVKLTARAVFKKLAGACAVGQTLRQLGLQCSSARSRKVGCNAVIWFGFKSLYFFLALHNESHGHRLHSACRQGRLDFLPQHRRQLKAHYTVKHTARLLGVDTVYVYGPRIFYRMQNGRLGDFMKYNTFGFERVEAEYFGQMPGYGFSLAVFIGCEPYGFGLLGGTMKLVDKRFLVGGYFVDGFEALVYVDAEVLFSSDRVYVRSSTSP